MEREYDIVRSYRAPRKIKQLNLIGANPAETGRNIATFMDAQSRLGFDYSPLKIHRMMTAYQEFFDSAPGKRSAWMDAAPTPTFNPSTITSAVQFLQEWLPGVIGVNTTIRQGDALIGMATVGRWEQQEVVLRVVEPTGVAQTYTDKGAVPLASWNADYERRTMFRGELGYETGILAQERSALSGWEDVSTRRQSVTAGLQIQRNFVCFYGVYGQNTYGITTDPGLSAYITVSTKAAGGTSWNNATFNEIVTDLITAAQQLRTQSGGLINPSKSQCTLAISLNKIDRLSIVNSLGTLSVREWISKTYPSWRIEEVPEFQAANAGADIFYLYAESEGEQTNITSSDDGAVWLQPVPTVDRLVGVQPMVKGILEDHSMATAGAICKRPYAVVRYTGI